MPIARFEMPDGRVGRFEVPDGTTPEQAHALISSQISKSPAQIIGNKTTNLAQDLYQGAIKDPIDAAGQIYGNAVLGATGQESVRQTMNDEISKNDSGFSAGRMIGSIVNPTNLIPGVALKRAADAGKSISALRAGSLSAPAAMVATPVTDGDFVSGKLVQGAAGFVGGAAGQKIGEIAGDALANRGARQDLQQQANHAQIYSDMNQALKEEGLPVITSLPQEIQVNLQRLANQVKQAMDAGKTMDIKALVRQSIGDKVLGQGAGLTLGQSNRDPMQWAREYNLKGIEGAGDPITRRLSLQNQRLIDSIRTNGIEDPYNAGTVAGASLKQLDDTLGADVTKAYTAFRNSTGKTIDVPLQPLMQTYGDVLDRFADKLPAAVRNRIESFTMGQGQQQSKVFDLTEADKMLKLLNEHYDPMNKAGNTALGELKKTLTQTLDGMADANASSSNQLLKTAIGKARDRFTLHDNLPALKEASFGTMSAPEKFVKDYVTGAGASVDQVSLLMRGLDNNAANAVRGAVRSQLLQQVASGAERGADTATISQAALKRALDSLGDRKLAAIFGQKEADNLRNVQYVAALIQKEPFGSMPNRSGTAAALANLVQSKFMSMPGINIARDSINKSMNEKEVRNALLAQIMQTGAKAEPRARNRLQSLIQVGTVPAAGSLAVETTK